MKDVNRLKLFSYLTMKIDKCYKDLTGMHMPYSTIDINMHMMPIPIETHRFFIDQVNCNNTKGLI